MSVSDYLSGIMHSGSQFLQVPTIACLIILTLLVLFCVGWLLVELFTERRHFKINHVRAITSMREGDYSTIRQTITESALLKNQKQHLYVVVDNMGLRDDELYALAQIEIEKTERPYKRRVNLTDMISKIGPMLGLMGTLIPLGPGIVAMGQGKVELLSQSLLIAFDTTILGLVSALVAMIVSRIRKTWYGQYSTVMRSLFMCVLDEAEAAREEGVELPYAHSARGDAAKANRAERKGESSSRLSGKGAVSDAKLVAMPENTGAPHAASGSTYAASPATAAANATDPATAAANAAPTTLGFGTVSAQPFPQSAGMPVVPAQFGYVQERQTGQGSYQFYQPVEPCSWAYPTNATSTPQDGDAR